MELQVGVKILLKNKEGKFLLVRRNPKKYPDVGPQWDIVGGRIIPGTPLIDNLKREIKEETGLDYSGVPKLVAAQDILKASDRHVVRLTYIGTADGNPQIDEESLEAKWFGADEIKIIDGKSLDGFFKELLEKDIIKL
ncbi:MAG: NUDIX hydrolase [Legionella sp.]|uniref:NUDIX hydrolase n=1 Tax=Legionella sp. TaxID=459 RepID=UPI0028452C4F|nr:NUDIX hydrolase [Legionella sp.]